jgi:N-acetylglutamate synthase-like GNAT family acetyltransferase
LALTADHVHPVDAGWVIRTPSLPVVWTLNQLRLGRRFDFSEVLTLAETFLGDLPFRHVVLEGDAVGRPLEDRFERAGWRRERELVMALSAEPPPPSATTVVIEPTEEEALGLMARWLVEERPQLEPGPLHQLVEFNRREGRARQVRHFGVADGDGTVVAITMLYSDGVSAQVENVYTVPQHRNRGFARTLVTHAASAARSGGHELVFIVADDDDWPKQLYSRAGFTPVERTRTFHVELA